MKKLGLDLGSSSIGWFLRDGEEILKFGTVIFDSGMVKGTSGYSSPTKDRREARLKRNPIKARKYRKKLILSVLVEKKMVPLTKSELENWINYKKGKPKRFPNSKNFRKWLQCDFSFDNGLLYKNPYELRVKALDQKLSPMELGRTLYHLVQRRGFKDIGETNKETKKQIERRVESGFQEALHKHRSIADALQNEYLAKNLRARDNYPYRDEYEDELIKILNHQGYLISKNPENQFVDNFVRSIHKAIIWQQPLKTQKGNIGKCTLEPKKKRCAVSHPLYEIFRAWQFINTIKVKNESDDYEFISQEYRNKLFKTVFLKKDANFKFEVIRKALDRLYQKNKTYNYPINSKTNTYETTVAGMPFCKKIITLYGDQAEEDLNIVEKFTIGSMSKHYNDYSLLDIWHNITEFDEDALVKFGKNKLNLRDKIRKHKGVERAISPLVELKNLLPKGYGNLSQFVLRKIIPLLKDGFLYNDAVLLANLPNALGENYSEKKQTVTDLLNEANSIYNHRKKVVQIVNKLIEDYKGKVEAFINGHEDSIFGYKDFTYLLQDSDNYDIKNACENHFGKSRWKNYQEKDLLINEVGKEYQEFFFDVNRDYRKLETLQVIFEELLRQENIVLKKSLYHHSKRDNLYGATIKYRNTDIDILPLAQTNAIKNPMFNKAMSVLRKLINTLIVNGDVDEYTEVIVEIARELNDNNKRIAIERYQKQRENKRKMIRAFLHEYKANNKLTLNVEESIQQFELWDEQILEATHDEKGKKQLNIDRKEILKEKSAIKRYELWMEQKGQCMYTGKMISISQLFSSTTNIEHTIPRILLPDNTLANQTIAFADYNTKIKNRELPINLPNYEKDVDGIGTAIKPRLAQWEKVRDGFKMAFETRQKPKGVEDEKTKNTRIQEKHFYKMHYDYWKDKIERFTATDVNDQWARRQLTDTQSISKYAREFLKTYFNKVAVQKGSVTSDFRKMLGFEDKENPKSRAKHTHHTVDAAVLTYIPSNASRRDTLIKKMYDLKDKIGDQLDYKPHSHFNSQKVKNQIENNTLIFNYKKDNVVTQTFKKVRNAGKIQYKKESNGNKLYNQPLMQAGDTIRTSLFKDSFLGKIKNVERFEDGSPKRNIENTDWVYKTGDDEFSYVKREDISKISRANLNDIVDPHLAEHIAGQLGNKPILDFQGNPIRHVRIKKKAGKQVKKRVDYLSDKDYKNFFYAESGSIPYGIMLFNPINDERELLQVHAYQVSEVFRAKRRFDIEYFVERYFPGKTRYKKLLLRIGQKLLVLKDDFDYEQRKESEFQGNRLYKIIKIDNGSLWLKYHLTATADDNIDALVKEKKDEILWNYEKSFGLPKVVEDKSIEDIKTRNEDLQRRKYKLNSWKDYRIQRLVDKIGKDKASEVKKELDKFKKVNSTIEIEGETPLLKLNTSKSWNFLYEGTDFELSILGELIFKE
ncbi:type II CRISPR RNA-guided endonuclease Cas9 [Seonamhaeicola sp.]|uniref:type II CRISPR RNA-guided endonuclease Cas9 n=1 Tax=Seonamhaeicola sp. TaxID=1912245 RepID=UPI00260772AA|nr:type II CRISPR RNA-guided endonuclease Cas9 [Seonamhaeicola sp.]